MIPAGFEYRRAGTVEEAIELLGADEDASLLAGGHSLLPAMKLRIARPTMLVDIGRLDDLRFVREDADHIAVGALTRHSQLAADPSLRVSCAVLAHTAGEIGDPQVRHRGTIGGSVSHADPASDLAAVLLTLDAELVARGSGGERTIAARDFFIGPFSSALAHDEVLVEIRVPKVERGVYLKHSRRAQDWATVAVAAADMGGTVHVGLACMGGTPLRASAVEQALASGASAADAAERAAEGTEPPSDVAASAGYRAHLARVLTRRALEQL
jgi:carbon-monoxide dehydrogenase medium subunit